MLSGNAFYSAVGAGPISSFGPCCGLWAQYLACKETQEFLWSLLGIAEPWILETQNWLNKDERRFSLVKASVWYPSVWLVCLLEKIKTMRLDMKPLRVSTVPIPLMFWQPVPIEFVSLQWVKVHCDFELWCTKKCAYVYAYTYMNAHSSYEVLKAHEKRHKHW